MVVQAPAPPPAAPAPPSAAAAAEIDAGVIEDARRRQHRHRRIGGALLAALAAGALLTSTAMGGGSGGGRPGANPSSSGPPGGSAHVTASSPFPGAPATQAGGYGVETDFCPLAPPNQYLPARSGCVTVRRADINGDGRPDLILVYSTLSRQRPTSYMGEPIPRGLRGDYQATAAFLKVVLADGRTLTTRIHGTKMTRAAAIDAISRATGTAGAEIFLEVERISSGGTVVAYGFGAGRLAAAGVRLGFGGDAAAAASFDCLPGHPARLVQRTYLMLGRTIYGWWKVRQITYGWHGPRLAVLSNRTFTQHGGLTHSDYAIGQGCLHGID